MFANNSYAKIKSIDTISNNYIEAKISITKKNKLNNKYELNFFNKVQFIGNAFKKAPKAGDRLKITQCGVQNCYVKNGKIEFMRVPQYMIFDYELQGQQTESASIESQMTLIEDNGDLPF